jgi:TetR/AcrR family transcriptional repressor of nem operon
MRYDDNHKERTRARVLAAAAAAIRRKGAERVGVAEVMAGAGLTHGGFYAHFTSKDDLVAQAVAHMFDAAYARFLSHTEGREPAEALSRYIDAYLATSHRLDRAHGCPIAALSGDLPNMPELARARFIDGTERLVAGIAKLVKKLGAKHAEALAW